MSTTKITNDAPRRPALSRPIAMRLAAAEYRRFGDVLAAVGPADWSRPTNCPGWDVRAIAGHALGMAEMAASIRAQRRQVRAAAKAGGSFIDALTALQVAEHAGLSQADVVANYRRIAPKAARGRRLTPGLVRRRPMPQRQIVSGREEVWTIGFLLDVILTRDPWMHRIDIAAATGTDLQLTQDHDGVLVDDIVREWLQRHGQPVSLRLLGPAGGSWSVQDGPTLELDAIDFCLAVSGRAPADGLLATEVPF